MANIHKLIAAISPDIYCDEKVRKEVKEIIKKDGYKKAAEKADPIKDSPLFNFDVAKDKPLEAWGLRSPKEEHSLRYDSPSDGVEPIYFWLLDFIGNLYRNTEKITDNFVSSPGSGHFSEMQSKATQMQQEVSRTMGNVNTVIKSVLNLIYDLKEFKLRLDPYKLYKSKNEKEREIGLLSLKQIWLDNVDIKKSAGSINALASGQLDFVTLRDAFMAVRSTSDVDKIDLNERVKRILKQRMGEFTRWIDESESSITQRYNIEKNYLKSQVNMLKLYTRWVKPYLKAAQRLEQQYNSKEAALVTTFNTILLELKLLASSEYKPQDDVDEGILPKSFSNRKARKYSTIMVVELNFRGIPQRISQRGDWGFGGKVDVKFTSYALNDQELKVLKKELEEDDIGEAMKLIQGATEDSLDQIKKEIEEFTMEDKKKEEKKEKNKDDTNPFSVLFNSMIDLFKVEKKDKNKEEDLSKGIKPDDAFEKIIRSQAIISSREKCYKVFDIYKKTHGMASHASAFDAI